MSSQQVQAPAHADTPPPTSSRGNTGRTNISGEQWDAIVEAATAGAPLATCATAAGVKPSTLRSIMSRYRHGQLRHAGLIAAAQRLARAEATTEIEALKTIRTGSRGWEGPAWYLERRYPDRYGRRQRLDITGTVKQLRELGDSELAKLRRQAELTLGGQDVMLEQGKDYQAVEGQQGHEGGQ